MRKLKQIICCIAILIALSCIVMTATNVSLALHLGLWSHEHHHDSHKDCSKIPDNPAPQHDHAKCPICHMLTDSSGKYICYHLNPTILTIDLNYSNEQIVSTFITQHNFSPAIPRGPPLA